MTLRDQCVEAAAKAIRNECYDNGPGSIRYAERAFDAILDTLEANADEWFQAWTQWADPIDGDPKFIGLVAALRGSNEEEE